MPMKPGKIKTAAVLFALSVGVVGCGEWHGAKTIDTTPPNDRTDGPGLFTGKEGGIVFYVDPWSGASPHGGSE
jgi:hypothetical protein